MQAWAGSHPVGSCLPAPRAAPAAAAPRRCSSSLRQQHVRRQHQQQQQPCEKPPAPRGQPPHALRSVRAASSFLDDGPQHALQPASPDPALANADLLPVPADKRTFQAVDFAALWVTLVISVSSYYLAASLVDLGMCWWQGVLTVLVGNLFTLVPLVLNAHPGTKYGLPFPVLARASFGIKGANVPSLARGLVACAWFGINSFIGGNCVLQMLQALSSNALPTEPLAWLGISAPQLASFMAFWGLQLCVVVRGTDTIQTLETCSAPILVALALALLGWAVNAAGGFGPMLAAPSQFGPGMPQEGRFWSVFLPAVTANVGYWATLSLNIPDFSRYAVSQRAQAWGQAVGLPACMALFSFIGLAVTSATVVIFGTAVRDPVQLLSQLRHPAAIALSLVGLLLATLTTNIAANVVAPANALVSAAPRSMTFVRGAVVTAVLGLLTQPWRLYESFIGFLVASSVLLGPVIAVVMVDYHVVRGRQLDVDALFSTSPAGAYWYNGGYNRAALLAVALGVAPCVPGLLAAVGLVGSCPGGPVFRAVYDCGWFVGVAVASAAYCWCMRQHGHSSSSSSVPPAAA